MDIGFIGLGAMGKGMAKNLAAAGHNVKAWNRSGGQVEGVTMVGAPADALQGDAAFTMLSDDAAIRAVLLASGALAKAKPGLVHVCNSTISVAFARELDAAHKQAGVGYVSAPVLGRPDVAAAGQLNVLAAGDPAAVEKVRPLLDKIGGKVWDLGESAPQANAVKIACNMMITMAIEAMAEGVALTEPNGVPRQKFFEVILGTLFGARAYQVYSGIIAEERYEPAGFKAVLGLKDLRLATEAAAEHQAELPMLRAVHGQMKAVVDAGGAERDWSAMAELAIKSTAKG
jgi:3-hydroxyisobutyrate dehydrogenase-like beta-hydroxyacid dehydrogenase